MSVARSLAAVLAAVALPLHALELRVLSAGAVEPGMRPALAAFERATGHTVAVSFAAAPALRSALRAPAPAADIAVVPQAAIDELAAAGANVGTARAPIGKVGVGVAIRNGADTPDITSVDALKAALASADKVVFNRASTGLYVEQMLQRIGVADAVRAKTERVGDGASVLRRLLAGSSPREFGFAATTEIVLFRDRGAKLVGPLPAAVQNYTRYVALPWPGGPPADSARAQAVDALMRHLQSQESQRQFSDAGIDPTP
jgi:molybdate transport system substrate-binding protein